jgi:hypothetical protein
LVKEAFLLLILSGLLSVAGNRIEDGGGGDSLITGLRGGAMGQYDDNPQVDSKLSAGIEVKLLGAG